MLALLKTKLVEVVKAIAPLVAAVCLIQVLSGDVSTELFVRFLIGSALAVAGMVLLFIGIDFGVLPMGHFVGAYLPRKGSWWLMVGVAFALGVATTIAEPDVVVLATQVAAMSGGEFAAQPLSWIIAIGVGVFVALALLRIIWGLPMVYLLAVSYGAVIILSFIAPPELVPLAYDAGSVTTGVLTAPVVLALALGVSSVLADRSAVTDGFGLLGFASIGPIIALLLLGILR